jgi:protein O-mannosyl-transferase
MVTTDASTSESSQLIDGAASVLAVERPLRVRSTSVGSTVRSWSIALLPLFLAIVTIIVFLPGLQNGFVDWDDEILFTKNPHYRGLAWSHIAWSFSNVTMGHYVPITWLTLGLDYVLWGMDPAGYHFTNLVLHAANAVLFYFLALRLLRAATAFSGLSLHLGAATSALFFALHPLRAESVAWVTERRDVLSGLFFFLTLLAYLQARERQGPAAVRRHALACVCYLLAILSKSMVMTLPALLVLLDMYPFRRLDARPRTWLSATVWREKLPYFALGALAIILGYYAQAANSFITSTQQIPWSARPALIAYSLAFYVEKTLLPLNLSPLYELPAKIDLFDARFLASSIGVVAVSAALWILRKRVRAVLTIAVSYAIMLAPVSGIVHSGYQLAHDRYSYLPCLGWALLVGAGAAWIIRAGERRSIAPAIAKAAVLVMIVWLVGLAALTWRQVEVWHDTGRLWEYALDADPDCAICLYNHGAMLYNAGFPGLAKERFERLMTVRPDRARSHANIGLAHAALGDLRRAVTEYQMLLARVPDDVEAHNNLGVIWATLGRPRDAVQEFRWALRLEDNAVFRANLALALLDLGKTQDAIREAKRAVADQPHLGQARFALALASQAAGDSAIARQHYEILRAVDAKLAARLGPALVEEW